MPKYLKMAKRAKKYTYFIGTDISKHKLDHAVMQGKVLLFHQEIGNDADAIMTFIRKLKTLPGFSISKAVFCMENTGMYCNFLLGGLQKLKANIVVEGTTRVRNSLGNIRGKNDKMDAIRLAEYAFQWKDSLRFWVAKRPVMYQLADLSALRTRLLRTQGMLNTPLKEQKLFLRKGLQQQNVRLCSRSLASIKLDLDAVNCSIAQIVSMDERLNRLQEVITSVPGVGPVTALQLILATNEFKAFHDPKKFACYAGVAPFAKESGTIKGRARVSHMANKKMKALLHTCALNAIRFEPDLQAYYQRKGDVEGKNKMSVLNAVRYKLILRIFVCVNQDRCYEKVYSRPVINDKSEAPVKLEQVAESTVLMEIK